MIPPAFGAIVLAVALVSPAHRSVPDLPPHAVVQRAPATGIHGRASWVRASLGTAYMAARLPRGTRLTVTGPHGAITARTTDYGPSSKIRPVRVVDLSRAWFSRICGDPILLGTCPVTVTVR